MKDLTDEALNIAICEWRGWKNCEIEETTEFGSLKVNAFIGPKGERTTPSHITGLEALGNMHEAEKGLSVRQRINYARELSCVCDQERVGFDWWAIFASARQRAIALLRVAKPELFQ